ncbi:tRNA dimethylallyltransferase [Acididesulfobacillus acetoxydans]|uniref:tRNA dimethylallyltransferase n=1 Tax=Acididesulfobacillus acetoxydans TaxID=1561005 RepID=A0A8S0XXT5_9FIRM|nr:tRNA (adenosine(37)-N6)-dimethylallyltransferase MiaA [Acididesulfobacillus acetoxydans]CAA7601937.1 tRNA dimethylallyltransferase [Acididesulfobacillus acetoxydans]CEJ08219.1 tRNA dimethylallyltransferase [Acididesulfobacillus acetoxydans]
MRPFVVIVGPTAVGKSALGLDLARAVRGEIISGDSVQVYRKLDIGSAKTPPGEREGVPHHLFDFLDPREPYSAAQFQEAASRLISEIQARDHVPILVGGTGLYVRSLLDPYRFSEKGSGAIRQKWLSFLAQEGKEALHRALAERDPLTAARLHVNDRVRVIRALEVFELTGRPLSGTRTASDKVYAPLAPNTIYIGLEAPREILYRRIDERCAEMIREGLVEETADLLHSGYSRELKPLQSLGYRHVLWYLRGLATLPEALRLMQRDTRHFAKRQFTWFRRDPRITWYDISRFSPNRILADVICTCRALETRVE